jgi:uncharacterized protein YjbI with pentapeptide repeats
MASVQKFEVRNRWTNVVQFTAEIAVTPDVLPSVNLGLAVFWARRNDADLSGAYLRGAYLSGAYLSGAYLRDVDLSGANLRRADLSGAYLRGANLRGANLRGANLSDADLSGTDLRDADLRGANLRGANLSDADLRGAYLSDAYLRGANLSGADLSGTDLRGTDLRDADLSDADLRSFKSDLWTTLHYARAEVPGLIAALIEGRVDGSQYKGKCACLVGTLASVRGAEYTTAFPDHSSSHPAEQWFLMIRKGDKPGDESGGGFAALKALEWAVEYCDLSKIKVSKAAWALVAGKVVAA